ncbi:unnamed protein product [Callosobruchus maculatus]|uniref:Endoplasmic reticulum resident protein 29 C-terminal domain-containing protein n=1 Tax=Callosobruchus maculatus TaxID=64391 RepID=A0A653DQ49_CALMS|nr:unnamed protein product [Callosobruchus maculatus]
MYKLVSHILLLAIFVTVFSSTEACKGCVNIDEFNFDKIVPKFEAVLVKLDAAYPYGDKHQVFTNLAEEIVDVKPLLLAQVGVKDYGDKENVDFAAKYGIKDKNDLPALRLFVQGEDEPFVFEKHMPWNEENLKKFIRDHTNIYLGLPGCLEAFDKLAEKFMESKDKKTIYKEAEMEANKLKNEREKTTAKTYLKFMEKVQNTSSTFVTLEIKRLEKIINEGKVSQKKKDEISRKLNILKSFSPPNVKTEL